ncbi:hypothetical protein HanRHA438_Chr05g0220531 [Helianthus annuus]|nr:hypothetical protein HanRHA438_Chr05g0220531 [Helianthus annuus]
MYTYWNIYIIYRNIYRHRDIYACTKFTQNIQNINQTNTPSGSLVIKQGFFPIYTFVYTIMYTVRISGRKKIITDQY